MAAVAAAMAPGDDTALSNNELSSLKNNNILAGARPLARPRQIEFRRDDD